MDFFVEIILELYAGFLEMLMPDREFKKWQLILLRILSFIITAGILVCIAIGIDILREDASDVTGIICTATGSTLFAVQTAIFIIVLVHKIKEEKRKKKCRKKSVKQANQSGQTEQSDGEE